MSDAVYAFVYALDNYHKDKCKGKAIFCDELKQHMGTATLASELYQYLKNVTFTGLLNIASFVSILSLIDALKSMSEARIRGSPHTIRFVNPSRFWSNHSVHLSADVQL